MYGNMVLWNGAREILHLFCCYEWETSSHNIAILGVRLIRNRFHSVSSYFGGVLPGITILGGF